MDFEELIQGGFSAARSQIGLFPYDPDLPEPESRIKLAKLKREFPCFRLYGMLWFFTLSAQKPQEPSWILINHKILKIWGAKEKDIFYAAMDNINSGEAVSHALYKRLSHCCDPLTFVEIRTADIGPPFAAPLLLSTRVYKWLYRYLKGDFYFYPYTLPSVFAISKESLDKNNDISPLMAFRRCVNESESIPRSPYLTSKILVCREREVQVITPIFFLNGNIFLV